MNIIRSINFLETDVFSIITEVLLGSASTISSSTWSISSLGVGIIISSSSALLTSIAILITNDNISKLKIKYTKINNWTNVISLLYEKPLQTSMVDKNDWWRRSYGNKKDL